MTIIEKGDVVKYNWGGKMGEVFQDLLNGTVSVQFASNSTVDVLAKSDLKLVCKRKNRLDLRV